MARGTTRLFAGFLVASSMLRAQVAPQPTAPPQSAANPLAIGEQALEHERWAEAQKFFENFLQQNPDSALAQYYLGFAYFGQKQYPQAEQVFLKLTRMVPSNWGVHSNLAEVYAAEERWPDFDRERKLVHDARQRGEQGLSKNGNDVIDVLYVSNERYIVREFDPLVGHFHTRYNVTHFGKDGKADFWIACESDDVDQTFFAQKHPKEAAAGQRSFSLDSYSQSFNATGQLVGQTHGTLKFYPDGEPTYETVRTDVLNALQHKAAAMSTTTTPVPANEGQHPKP